MTTVTLPQSPSTTEVTSRVMLIAPQLAQRWLTKNKLNRPLSSYRVTRLADAIRRGEWRVNGQAIIFSNDNRLLDGQHRLAAICECGLAVSSVVVEGIDPDAFRTIDQGQRRSMAQMLAMTGEENVTELASGLRTLWLWRKTGHFQGGGSYGPTSDELFDLLKREPAMRRATAQATALYARFRPARKSVMTPLIYRFWLIDQEDAHYFFDHLGSGVGYEEGSPILRLRERLAQSYRQESYRKLTNDEIAALTIKAWNTWRKGERMTMLSWRAGGSDPEDMPVPQ